MQHTLQLRAHDVQPVPAAPAASSLHSNFLRDISDVPLRAEHS